MKLEIKQGQNLYFTSDTHYAHTNICRGTTKWVEADSVTRDFKTLSQMNDAIVNNINELVGQDDILIHLGDWSFGGFEMIEEFRNRIICKNIHLVFGNHDHHIKRDKNNVQTLFTSVHDYLHLNVKIPYGKEFDRMSFACMHYPIASWNGLNDGVIHLHGHVHLPPHLRIGDGKAMDVGVDGNNLFPISIQEIGSIMKNRPIKKLSLPKDHHEKRI